jgi:hypothetical protein
MDIGGHWWTCADIGGHARTLVDIGGHMDITADKWTFSWTVPWTNGLFRGHFRGQMDICVDICLDKWTLSWTFAWTNGHYLGQNMDIVVDKWTLPSGDKWICFLVNNRHPQNKLLNRKVKEDRNDDNYTVVMLFAALAAKTGKRSDPLSILYCTVAATAKIAIPCLSIPWFHISAMVL